MCTNLTIQTGPGNLRLISARTLDFGSDLNTMVGLVPRYQSFPSDPPPQNPLRWNNQFGFIGMGVGTARYYMDGLNEMGLSAAALWLPGTQYPAPGGNPILYNIDFVGWVLGNFASVEAVQTALQSSTVIDGPSPGKYPLHFAISDAQGKHCVVEFMNQSLQFYQSDTGVMTNAPSYDWHLTNLSNYETLTLANNPEQWWGQELNGSGLLGLPGDQTPPSRFVRAVMLQQSQYPPPDNQHGVGLALQILQNFVVSYGTILASNGQSMADYTQWGVVRDHANCVFYFFSAFNNTLYRINLTELDFSKANPKQIPVAQPDWYSDITQSFSN